MCGIAGFTHAKWVPERNRIQTAVASLIHRGPDQQDVFQSNRVSVGATRLKIIDLVCKMRFRLRAIDSLFSANMHLHIADLEPEPATPFQRIRLLDLRQPK